MTFIGNPDQLVIDRYTAVPIKIVEFVVDIAFKSILDVGCGEMMCIPPRAAVLSHEDLR